MKYKKKPVTIEAFQYDGSVECFEPWAKKALENDVLFYNEVGELNINTLEGVMLVHVSDYVIQGVKGEIYPCREDIFMQTYEADAIAEKTLV
ncbi:MAG: hypothetical protein NC131_17245 [Roseburia sp.]|nr:hypothetical protein [Roseburia sp.]